MKSVHLVLNLAGWYSSEDGAIATTTVKEQSFDLVLGQRVTLSEDAEWQGFLDLDLAVGRTSIDAAGSSEELNRFGVGAYLGADVTLAPRLSLGARVGLEYTEEEVSAARTDSRLELGAVDVELTWHW